MKLKVKDEPIEVWHFTCGDEEYIPVRFIDDTTVITKNVIVHCEECKFAKPAKLFRGLGYICGRGNFPGRELGRWCFCHDGRRKEK